MEWTLLVPGALVPASLAPSISNAALLAPLLDRLRAAHPGAIVEASEECAGAAHWSWLARCFALADDPPVTAPYAWFAGGPPAGPEGTAWIAHAEPVHLALARDHAVVSDIGAAALDEDASGALLELANQAAGAHLGLRFAARGGRWFLLSQTPWQVRGPPLDAVLGRPAHDMLPTGADARRWRVLGNEIQMAWHENPVNLAREERGASPVNALWLHGGGVWAPLPATAVRELRCAPGDPVGEAMQGWRRASAGAVPGEGAGQVLGSFDGLRRARARRDWTAWLEALPGLERHLAGELDAARARGAARFSLVLCGERQARSAQLDLRRTDGLATPWWRRALAPAHTRTQILEAWLAEDTAGTAAAAA